jgi:hypothetical protein
MWMLLLLDPVIELIFVKFCVRSFVPRFAAALQNKQWWAIVPVATVAFVYLALAAVSLCALIILAIMWLVGIPV